MDLFSLENGMEYPKSLVPFVATFIYIPVSVSLSVVCQIENEEERGKWLPKGLNLLQVEVAQTEYKVLCLL